MPPRSASMGRRGGTAPAIRVDTLVEVDYLRDGGTPPFVLRRLLAREPTMPAAGSRNRMPLLPLEDVGGPEAWWQRKEMLVALLHDRCDECRRFRGALQEALSADPDRELGVALLSAGAAGEPLPSAPPDARFVRALRTAIGLEAGAAYVVVADRFGDVTRALPIHASPEHAARSALDSVDSIELQCPE